MLKKRGQILIKLKSCFSGKLKPL